MVTPDQALEEDSDFVSGFEAVTEEYTVDEKPAIQKPRNVTKIDEGRKPEKVSDPKIPKAVFYMALADAINHRPWSKLPTFPRRLVIYSASAGMRVIGELGDDDVVTIHENDVATEAAIMTYLNTHLAARDEYRWTARMVRDARDFWVLATDPLEDVAAFRWASEPGYTFNRLPWDPGETGRASAPTWELLLSRMSNARALCEWIGSLFVPDSDTHQYVWLYGTGGDGKGAINRFLAKVFGGSYAAKQPPKAGDRFWTFGLIGKRLVAFPDCNDVRFIADGLFKSLTGGDPVDVEAKGKMSFTYRPTAKYFHFSNEKPKISSEKADTRRIIYCEFEPNLAAVDPAFEDRLWEEGGYFLTRCIAMYHEAHPRPGPIVCDQPQLGDWLSVVEERYEVIYEKHFVKPIAPYDTTSGLNRLSLDEVAQKAVLPRRMQDLLRYYFKSDNQAGEFIKWLEVKHGVKKKTLALPDDHEPKVYVGIAERMNSYLEVGRPEGLSGRPPDMLPDMR